MIFAGYSYRRDPSTNFLVGSLEDIKAHYAGLGRRLGVTFEPPEVVVNELGYRYLAADSVQLGGRDSSVERQCSIRNRPTHGTALATGLRAVGSGSTRWRATGRPSRWRSANVTRVSKHFGSMPHAWRRRVETTQVRVLIRSPTRSRLSSLVCARALAAISTDLRALTDRIAVPAARRSAEADKRSKETRFARILFDIRSQVSWSVRQQQRFHDHVLPLERSTLTP